MNDCKEGYLMLHPDVYKQVKEVKIKSGINHWNKYGKKREELPIVRNGSSKVMGKSTKHGDRKSVV